MFGLFRRRDYGLLTPEHRKLMNKMSRDARKRLQEAGLWENELEARKEIRRRVREARVNTPMRELIKLVEEAQDDREELVIETNCADRLKKLIEWIKDTAATGTGITITAEDNGGEKMEIYIDGDGPDRIYSVK